MIVYLPSLTVGFVIGRNYNSLPMTHVFWRHETRKTLCGIELGSGEAFSECGPSELVKARCKKCEVVRQDKCDQLSMLLPKIAKIAGTKRWPIKHSR